MSKWSSMDALRSGVFLHNTEITCSRTGKALARYSQAEFITQRGKTLQEQVRAVMILRLALVESTVRDIVAGKPPYTLFNGVLMGELVVSMIWGDFEMYETGEPEIRGFIAVPGALQGLPPPSILAEILAALKPPSSRPKTAK